MNVRVNMGCDVWSLIVVIAIALFGGIRAEYSGVNNRTGMTLTEGSMFTECPSNESNTNCSSTALNSCNRINILEEFNWTISRARQDIDNVICLDTGQQLPINTYQLVGCPTDGYFSTNQSTEGVCHVDTENTRILLLRPTNMVTGLHSFICSLQPIATDDLYIYAIALNDQGNDAGLFTDVRVYRSVEDGEPIILARPSESVNVNVKEGDNLTIVARVVTTLSGNIKAIASSPLHGENATDRFTILPSGIDLCNNDNSDNKYFGLGRYQLYGLQATLGDDQTMMRIFINFTGTNDTITIGQINITVNENPTLGSTTMPVPTVLPSERGEDDDSSATGIILVVVIPLLLLIVLLIAIVIAVLIVVQRRRKCVKSKHIEDTNSNSRQPLVRERQTTNRLKVLVYACGHYPIDLLLSRLRQNDDKFIIDDLTEPPSLLFNDYISKMTIELKLEAVLVDCGCPAQAHDDLHKAVKYFTLKPFGSDESKHWKVLQLIHTDGEINSRSWSPSLDHVEVMCYNELNDEVVDDVVKKLEECMPASRTSSIGSKKVDAKLLEGDVTELLTAVNTSTKTIIQRLDKHHQEQQDKVDVVGEDVSLVKNRQVLIMEDVRRPFEEGQGEQHNEEN